MEIFLNLFVLFQESLLNFLVIVFEIIFEKEIQGVKIKDARKN